MPYKFNPFTSTLDYSPTAVGVPFDNTVTGQLAATNVQDAIDELTGSVDVQTPNRFAGFDASGDLESINNWVRNSLLGADVNQAPTPTDPGVTASFILNSFSTVISPTNNLSNSYIWQQLDQINLYGTFDYLGVTGHEFFITQGGINDITGDLVAYFPRIQLGAGGVGSTSQNDWVIKAEIRSSGNHTSQSLTGIRTNVLMDSGTTTNEITGDRGNVYVGGTTSDAYGINQTVQVDGTLTNVLYGFSQSLIASGGSSVETAIGINNYFSGNIVNSYTGEVIAYNGDVGNTFIAHHINHQGSVTNLAIGYNYARDGASLGGLNVFNANVNSSSPVTGNFRFLNFTNDAAISEFGAGTLIYQSGAVTKGWVGHGVYVSGNVGDGTSNIVGTDISFGGAVTLNGFIYGLNFNNTCTIIGPTYGSNVNNQGALSGGNLIGHNFVNNGAMTGSYDIMGGAVSNSGAGYRFIGFTANNSADMSEEIRGYYFYTDGDARTATGLDIIMSGNITDDARAIRVDVSALTSSSTTNHIHSAEYTGGLFSIQSAFSPFSGVGVDVGNNFTVTTTIPLGTPLTGTDQILTLMQPNLIADDDIATGPFGLDTNMFGLVSEVAVGSGKTIPLLRTMLLGTSVPLGSGGTITEHVVLEMLGLPSFGGSVTCPTKVGIQDSILLGQAFSDGATANSWFIRVRDEFVENHLPRLAINTTSLKNSTNVRLEVRNGHVKSDQTTPPAIAANTNAGTGATASVTGATDTAGSITLTTGTGAWAAGPQADITFDLAYNAAPKIVLFPREVNAAAASTNVYVTRSTTGFSIEFVAADVAATTYEWDYVIIETI